MGDAPETRRLERLFFGWSRRDMDCYRSVDFCLEHRFGTSHRPCRSRSIERYGYGPLGNTGMDDIVAGLGICPFLFSKYGIYDARVSRAPLQPAITHYFVSDFSHQLCPHQSGRNRICRRIGFPAGFRHRYFMGNRLLLDSRHRIGCHYGALHDFRRYEIGTLHLGIANAYTSSRIAYHLGSRI